MIGLVTALPLVVAQLVAAAPLVVRDAQHSVRVPTVSTSAGVMLRPDALSGMLPITIHHDSSVYYTLEVWGARLQLQSGVPIVRVGGETRQLASAPMVRGGHLLVPLQLVSDVFPSAVPNTRWDAESSQLVVFASLAPADASGARGRLTAADDPRPRSASPSPVDDSRLPPIPIRHHRRMVIVDAGHGGVDDGMRGPLVGGPKLIEKDITLSVAKKLGNALLERGVDVAYTRTTDTLIALDDRGRIANRDGGDLFISVHVNAANPTWKDPAGARGFETYFLSEAHTEDARRVEEMENAAVRYETTGPAVDKNDPLSFILSDMRQNEHLRESSELADAIQHRLGKMHPGPDRGVKQAGFRVLVTAYMPSVLVEIGFGTNAREAAFLSDPARQRAIASAIADGAMEYLQGYERRVAAHAGAGSTP
jgi:N-acetylmuramoyl-L-alanine amidase